MIIDNNVPFYYEVKFKLISYDEKNNIKFDKYSRLFIDENPILARIDAFEAFNDYIKFLRNNNRIAKDELGNIIIIERDSVSKKIADFNNEINEIPQPSFKNDDIKAFFLERREYLRSIEQIRESKIYELSEEIELNLVLNPGHSNNQDTSKNEKFYPIYRVTTMSLLYDEREDEMINNLETELQLYDKFNFDSANYRKTIEYYGYHHDSYEEGDKEYKELNREILITPHIWYSYNDFLKDQADVKVLQKKKEGHVESNVKSITHKYEEIIKNGESNDVEFKSVLQYDFKTNKAGSRIRYIIAKTINGFLNSNGGFLFVGINDDEEIIGIDKDYSLFKNENKKDKIKLAIDNLISHYLDISLIPLINASIIGIKGKDIIVIIVDPSPKPVFLIDKKEERKIFYIRANASTRELKDVDKIIDYIFNKNW